MKAGPDIARDPLGACHHSAMTLDGPEEARDLIMRGEKYNHRRDQLF
jgi:hypothetical protein